LTNIVFILSFIRQRRGEMKMKKFPFFTKLGISMGIFPRPSPMNVEEEEKDPLQHRPPIDPGLRRHWSKITARMKTVFP